MSQYFRLIVILVVAVLALTACGRKGPVRPLTGEPPVNSVTTDQPQQPNCCN